MYFGRSPAADCAARIYFLLGIVVQPVLESNTPLLLCLRSAAVDIPATGALGAAGARGATTTGPTGAAALGAGGTGGSTTTGLSAALCAAAAYPLSTGGRAGADGLAPRGGNSSGSIRSEGA